MHNSDGLIFQISLIVTCPLLLKVSLYAQRRETKRKQAVQETTLNGATAFISRGNKLRAALTSFSHRCLQLRARSGEATVVDELLHPSFCSSPDDWLQLRSDGRKGRVGKGKIALRKVKPTRPVRWLKGATLTTFKPSNNARGVHVWRKNHRHDSEADTDARIVQLRPSCGRKAFNLQRFEWNAPALENTCTEQRT